MNRKSQSTRGFVVLWCSLLMSLWACNATTSSDTRKVLETQNGMATYYSKWFQGKETANGEEFDNRDPTAAHRTYPLGTVVRVTNVDEGGKSVVVRINDRGPYGENWEEGTIIDLSQAAAKQLGMMKDGQVNVKVEVLEWGDNERVDEPK
ncbi:septal ring lytic transglycosylase RlpA family protein [Nibrella saemangeumensis]